MHGKNRQSFSFVARQSRFGFAPFGGNPPLLRIYGDLARVDAPVVTTEELLAVLREMVPMERVQAFEQTGDLDFAYEIPGLARYRANFFRQNRRHFRGVPRNPAANQHG